jgi:hypothetical protein
MGQTLSPKQPAVEAAIVAAAITRGIETGRKIMFRTLRFVDLPTSIPTALFALSLTDTIYQAVNLNGKFTVDGTTLDDGADLSFVDGDTDLVLVVTIHAEYAYDAAHMTSLVVAQNETVKSDVDRQIAVLLTDVHPHSVLVIYVLDESPNPAL